MAIQTPHIYINCPHALLPIYHRAGCFIGAQFMAQGKDAFNCAATVEAVYLFYMVINYKTNSC